MKSPVEKTDQATFLFAYGVAEPDGILDALTADENSHVAAEPGLIVEHMASQRDSRRIRLRAQREPSGPQLRREEPQRGAEDLP